MLGDVHLRRAYDKEVENCKYSSKKSQYGEISEFVRWSDMEMVDNGSATKFVWSCRCSGVYELHMDDLMVNGDVVFESIVVNCNGCSLKVKVVNDMNDDDHDEVVYTRQ